jgi:hypothetical protein
LPNLAVRDRLDLTVSLYPSGTATFTDVETLHGGRSYSLWDFMSEINTVVLYVTDGDDASFTLLQRTTGRKTDCPPTPSSRPTLARPDRRLLRAALRTTGALASRATACGSFVATRSAGRCVRDMEGSADDRHRLPAAGGGAPTLTRRLADRLGSCAAQ